MFVIKKITSYKNIKKVMTSNAWHCFCSYCTKETGLIIFQHYHVTQRLVGTYSVGSKTKSKDQDYENDQSCKTKTKTEAGLRPVLL